MTRLFLSFFYIFLILLSQNGVAKMKQSFFEYEIKLINGKNYDLAQLKGKVILAVNTASKCGFTGQYKDLQKIHEKYKDQGLVVIGFPSNDFGKQEPAPNEEISQFCQRNYGVDFLLAEKNIVKGKDKQSLFVFLTESNKKYSGEIKWNFEKFIINKEGQVVDRFYSFRNPSSKKITRLIESLL